MPAWLPALKVILPYVASVATTAIPAFTQRREGDKSMELMARQIAELQQAAGDNAESVKTLADQLQKALALIEQAGEDSQRRLRRAQGLSTLALLLAGVALGLVWAG